MKKLIIVLSLLVAINSCTTSGSGTSVTPTNDSTFNGNYVQLTIGSKSFYEKDVKVSQSGQLVTVAAVDNPNALLTGGTHVNMISITVDDPSGIYGLSSCFLYAVGTGTGTYQITNGYTTGGGLNVITQRSPVVAYDDTSGTMNITHNGSDYIQGTINTTLYANGSTYPTTGSFKINW